MTFVHAGIRVALVFAAVGGAPAFAGPAMVANWGHDDWTCGAAILDDDGGVVDVVDDGKGTSVFTADGHVTFTCTDGTWLLDWPDRTLRGEIDCGFTLGKFVLTPSGKFNFTCIGWWPYEIEE